MADLCSPLDDIPSIITTEQHGGIMTCFLCKTSFNKERPIIDNYFGTRSDVFVSFRDTPLFVQRAVVN